MGKKGKGKGNSAAKVGGLKLDKFRRDTHSAQQKPAQSAATAAIASSAAAAARKRDQAKSAVYDEQLMELAERQFGKSKAASAHLRPAKPLVVAPPTLVLPQSQPEAFKEIDQLLHGEQAPPRAVAEPKKRVVSETQTNTRGMFSGLSDSEEDEEDAKLPSFYVAPATFTWQSSS